MNILQISILAICATILSVLLRKNNPDFSLYLSLTCAVVILSSVIDYIGEVSDVIKELVAKFSLNTEFFDVILKIVAVSYICEFASSICIDAGESSNALKVEFAGKIVIISLTIPIIISLADLLLTII